MKDLQETGKERAKIHTVESPVYFDENIGNMEAIIKFAKDRGVQVILCTFPTYKTYVEHLNKVQADRTFQTAEALAAKYPNVTYVNCLNDSQFISGDFYDADHLNESGARKMSLKMDSIISLLYRSCVF